jgi:hypothetical protein
MGLASEGLGQPGQAVDSYRRLLLLDPADPAEVNFRLARLLQRQDPAAARRYVLDALADAPRFRDAYRLLLQLGDGAAAVSTTGDQAQTPASPGGQP